MSYRIVQTPAGPRCQKRNGKFVKRSQCGAQLGAISGHLSAALGEVEICTVRADKNGRLVGKPKCAKVRGISRYIPTKTGFVYAEEVGAKKSAAKPGKKKAAKPGKKKAGGRKKGIGQASKACAGKKGKARGACMKRVMAGGSAGAKGGAKKGSGARKAPKKAAAKRKGRPNPVMAAAIAACKGQPDYHKCIGSMLSKTKVMV